MLKSRNFGVEKSEKLKELVKDDINLGFGNFEENPKTYQLMKDFNPYTSVNLKKVKNVLFVCDKYECIDEVMKFTAALKHYCPYWKTCHQLEINNNENYDIDVLFTSMLIHEAYQSHKKGPINKLTFCDDDIPAEYKHMP